MLADALDLAFRAMAFDRAVFALVMADARAAGSALLLLAVAGLTLAISQSVVLFANRVPPLRFGLALLLGGAQYAASAVGYALAFLAAGGLLGLPDAGYVGLLALVALAWAPNLLAPIELVPHLGLGFARLVDAWVAALVVAGLAAGLGVGLGPAVLLAIGGWLMGQLARLLAGPALARINWRLLEAATGRTLMPHVDPVALLRAHAAGRPETAQAGPRP